jgi:hypothetical protein
VPDHPGHDLSLAEIGGTQKSSDANWNNATIHYWGITDLIEGQGTQRGYFVNSRGGDDRDWGTFEGKLATSGGQITVEGTYQNTGGSGKFKGLSGKGTFKTKMTSPKDVEATWQGTYELSAAKAHAN